MGLEKFLVLDDATSIEYPKFLRKSEEKVKILQKRLAHKNKGSRKGGGEDYALYLPEYIYTPSGREKIGRTS